MISRIAGLAVAAAATVVVSTGSAVATPEASRPFCAATVNRPCAWQQASGGGIVGAARIDAADHQQVTMLRVEVKIQRAWGSPWETVATATRIRSGSIQLTTPAVATDYRTLVCATGGPADSLEQQSTTCTY